MKLSQLFGRKFKAVRGPGKARNWYVAGFMRTKRSDLLVSRICSSLFLTKIEADTIAAALNRQLDAERTKT